MEKHSAKVWLILRVWVILNDWYHIVTHIKELDMEELSVNAIISLLNVSDGRDQLIIQVIEDCEDLTEKVARITMSLHIGILYGNGFNTQIEITDLQPYNRLHFVCRISISSQDESWNRKKTNFLYPECKTTFEKDACCGSIPFDSGKLICCNGELSKKYDHTCCGKKLINPNKYGCCNDRKYDLRLEFPTLYVIKNDSFSMMTSLLVIYL